MDNVNIHCGVVTGAPCTTAARPPTEINFMSASKSPSSIALRSSAVDFLLPVGISKLQNCTGHVIIGKKPLFR